MRLGPCCLALVLAGASAGQPSFAKPLHGHGVAASPHHDAATGRKGKGVRAPAIGKNASPAETTITAPSPYPGLGADKSRAAHANFKISVPMNFQQKPPATSVMSAPAARSAITLPPHETMKAGSAGRVGPASAGFEAANNRRLIPAPIATASIAGRSKIDGTALIRPAIASTGLGGPAKAAGAIDGTAFRPKH